jgi:hypothetical protein
MIEEKKEATPSPTMECAKKDVGDHRVVSSLEDFTMLELDFPTGKAMTNNQEVTIQEHNPIESSTIPKESLVIVAETEKLEGNLDESAGESEMWLASLGDLDITTTKLKVHDWDCKTLYSDFIKQGLEYNKLEPSSVIMLFESPSSCSTDTSFHNAFQFRFHDWPPPKSLHSKSILGPLRYSLMNGDTYPSYLRIGKAPDGLMEHWAEVLPSLRPPHFATKVTDDDTVYAYLPVEKIKNHINDPTVHYHLAGKDAIHLMTQKTTKLLPDTRTSRPCVVKTTHSMGSKGIFIINDDQDEAEFEQFLLDSGNPTFVVTDFVDIARNVACHFFIHPSGEITWFGSNENHRLPDGRFSSDSYLIMEDQKKLKRMQLPFVEEVVQYCMSLGFWGFCGIDVLFNSKGQGYLVDINPRVTGSCPALMALDIFNKDFGFQFGLFRRTGDTNFYGSAQKLMKQVTAYNKENEGKSRIVVHSLYEPKRNRTRVNIGVYGMDLEECKTVLNLFAQPSRDAE